ncbi:hypothetical protein [Bradyrhizobium sp. CCBAU 11386]|uniref:hypothetical protein n=1 Tax=Bradyrhizobium sp. CCBAU 11386 TaxID=1630837 RepID=UPI002303B527|nr:hypothetical protein [Bradyrhizobium sp. CCBAU 11386]
MIDVEQQGGRELLRAAWSRIINPRHACMKLRDMLSQARRQSQACALAVRFWMSAARRAMSDEQGSAETILKEAHLATCRPLVMLCLGSCQETRSPPVEAVQTG